MSLMMELPFKKNLLSKLLLILSTAFFMQAAAQNTYWSKVETYPGYNQPYFIKTQAGKGLWYSGPNGIEFVNLQTKKSTLYTTDAEGNSLGYIVDIAIFKDSVYACNKDFIYALNPKTGKFKAYKIPAAAMYNQWKNIYASENGIAVAGDKSCVVIENQIPTLLNYPGKPKAGVLPFFGYTFGDIIIYSVGSMSGVNMTNKTAKKDVAIFTTDNIEVGFYEPGKGIWMKSIYNLLFTSADGEMKATLPLRHLPETIERMLQTADGKVLLYGKKAVYQLSVEGKPGSAVIKYPVVTKDWALLSYNLQKAKIALGNNGEIFYADNHGVYQQKGDNTTTLVRNKLPLNFVNYWNWLMPDGNFYSLGGSYDLYIFNGKGEVKKTSSAGSNASLATDGKNIYMGGSNLLLKKSAAGNFEKYAELPINSGTVITAATDGKIYFAGKDGIGNVQQGKVNFTGSEKIAGFPGASIQSIAVNNKNEILIFADSMYRYANGKLTGVPGTKMMLYKHYFDSKGGQYSSDAGFNGFYLKNNKVVPLVDIIREKIALPKTTYVSSGDMAMDYKGRVWLIGSYEKKTYLHLVEEGKVTAVLSEKELPLLNAISTSVFCIQKKLYVTGSSKGMMVFDLK